MKLSQFQTKLHQYQDLHHPETLLLKEKRNDQMGRKCTFKGSRKKNKVKLIRQEKHEKSHIFV